MNDAIALLAISQLVCLGAIFYLYIQLQAVKSANRRPPASSIGPRPAHGRRPRTIGSPATARAARAAYGAPSPPGRMTPPLRPLPPALATPVSMSQRWHAACARAKKKYASCSAARG